MTNLIYLNTNPFPTKVAFCPSKKAWKKFVKEKQLESCHYPLEDGCTTTFENFKTGESQILVTIKRNDEALKDWLPLVGLITHEAIHIWQSIKKDIGEQNPSSEFEAYYIQSLTQQMLDIVCYCWKIDTLIT